MKNGQFHNTVTVRNLPRVFMGSTTRDLSAEALAKVEHD